MNDPPHEAFAELFTKSDPFPFLYYIYYIPAPSCCQASRAVRDDFGALPGAFCRFAAILAFISRLAVDNGAKNIYNILVNNIERGYTMSNNQTNHLMQTKQIILRDVHCPYCNGEDAFLISEQKNSTVSLMWPPAYGLKFLLSVIYLSIVHIIINGLKFFEISRSMNYTTYGFCPKCGNAYPASPPQEVVEEMEPPRFCKIRKNKAITGLCRGISEYTGISVLWIRIVTFLYSLTVVGAFLYFLVAACVPAKEDIESGEIHEKTFKAAEKGDGRVLLGLCKGFSNYTDVPVAWIRLLAIILAFSFIWVILYLVFGTVAVKGRTYHLGKKGNGKVFFGICKGYSEYADMPLWVVRFTAVMFGLTIIGAIAYLIAGIVLVKKEKKNASE